MIDSFRGEYAFLSNMYFSPIVINGIRYTCAEAAFQAAKLQDATLRTQFSGLSGHAAKKLGRSVPLRPDWETIKIQVMRDIIHEKFMQNPMLREKLLATEGHELVEGNEWNDIFWGKCNGIGKNWLGRILEDERSMCGQPLYSPSKI